MAEVGSKGQIRSLTDVETECGVYRIQILKPLAS